MRGVAERPLYFLHQAMHHTCRAKARAGRTPIPQPLQCYNVCYNQERRRRLSLATTAKIIAIGNSAGIILPKETLARLNVQKGDTLYITEGSQGIRLLAFDTEFAAQMETAREVMRENRDVLQRLAE
jgi:putative addiction module antidote